MIGAAAMSTAVMIRSHFLTKDPAKALMARGMVCTSCPTPSISDGNKKSFHIQMAFRMMTVTNMGLSMGMMILKKICGRLQPSMVAASSSSKGMDFMNPWNMKTASGAPNPM